MFDLLVPEEGLEPSQGYPYRILSLTTSETTTQISLQEPIISSWRVLGVSCYRTRTKGGRKTALNPLIASSAHWMFNPVRLFNTLVVSAFLTRVRELSVSSDRGDGNGETVKMPMVRA